jgi:hypothetical protein
VALEVAKGEVVLVQVGGYGTGIRADSGALVYGESFARADADRDGFSPPQDCDDANAAVNPSGRDVPFDGIDQDCAGGDNRDADGDGAPSPPDCDDTPGSGAQRRPAAFGGREVPGNGVDEDCDGVALDVDGDGAPAPADCDDTPGGGAQRRPAAFGGVEVPGNGVDEDCAGGWAPARLEEPNVRIEGRIIPGRGLLVRRIRVERVRRGAQVRLLCRGRRCLRGTSRRARRDRMVLDVRDRVLPAGTVLEVRVWVPGAAGRYIAGRSVLKQVGGTGTTLSCARTLRAGTTQPAEGCRPR